MIMKIYKNKNRIRKPRCLQYPLLALTHPHDAESTDQCNPHQGV